MQHTSKQLLYFLLHTEFPMCREKRKSCLLQSFRKNLFFFLKQRLNTILQVFKHRLVVLHFSSVSSPHIKHLVKNAKSFLVIPALSILALEKLDMFFDTVNIFASSFRHNRTIVSSKIFPIFVGNSKTFAHSFRNVSNNTPSSLRKINHFRLDFLTFWELCTDFVNDSANTINNYVSRSIQQKFQLLTTSFYNLEDTFSSRTRDRNFDCRKVLAFTDYF